MALTTAVFDALTQILVLVRAAVPSTVLVYDGRPVTLDPTSDAVYVGMLDLYEVERKAADAQQEWAGMQPVHRYEDVTVHCVAYSWSGETADYATLRGNVKSYLGLIETAIRADLTVGGVFQFALFSVGGVNQGPADSGCSVDVPFTITGKARI